jgi:hypothetical protein
MIYPRMSAPGLRSRYVERDTEAVLAFASCVLVEPPSRSAYRILTLGAKPRTAFFMGVLKGGWNSLRVPSTDCKLYGNAVSYAPKRIGYSLRILNGATARYGSPRRGIETEAQQPFARPSKHLCYSRAGLRSLVRACMGCAEEYTAAACDSRPPLYQPEGLVCALHSVPSETGKPKVIGLYPSQVSDALISEKGAKGLNAGRSLAGWCIA